MGKRISQNNQLTAAQLATTDILPIVDVSAGQTKYITVKDLTGAPSFGWTATGESWAYSSWNSTYKIGIITVPTDATTKYSPGMRVSFSQATGGTKYAIIHAVSSTTLTLFFGTDYTLTNEAITSPIYSPLDTPFGFPKNPIKWMTEVQLSSISNQASPAADTWYNIGGLSIPIGIGSWRVVVNTTSEAQSSGGSFTVTNSTLSTATNTGGSPKITSKGFGNGSSATGRDQSKEMFLDLSSNTTYYLNFLTDTTATTNIMVYGNTTNGLAGTTVRAISSYL